MANVENKYIIEFAGLPDIPAVHARLDEIRSDLGKIEWTTLRLPEYAAIIDELKNLKTESTATSPESEFTNDAADGAPTPQDEEAKPVHWDERTNAPRIRAPYRFAPLSEEVVLVDEETPLDRPVPDGLSAELNVSIRFETPFLIGAGGDQNKPLEIDGAPAIPGATLRGWLRSLVEVLTFSRLHQTNVRRRFALRDFDHARYKAFAAAGARPESGGLSAGWLLKSPNGMAIVPADRWGLLPISSLPAPGVSPQIVLGGWTRKDRAAKYRAGQAYDWNKPSNERKPRKFKKVEDVVNDHHRGWCYALSHDDEGEEGYLVVSDKLPGDAERRYEYVFFGGPCDTAPVPLLKETVADFESLNPLPKRSDPNKPANSWDALKPLYEQGVAIPVFYTGVLSTQGPDFSFGLTKLYRLPHGYAVGDKIPEAHRLTRSGDRFTPDLTDALFGFVHEEDDIAPTPNGQRRAEALRGRIAISFARPAKGARFEQWPPDGPAETVQGEPKPGFAPLYLVGERKDWSEKTAKLAGRKRYLPRRGAESGEIAEAAMLAMMRAQIADVEGKPERRPGMRPPKNVGAALTFARPATPGAEMAFTIRLHNVRRWELGAVAWALTMGGDPEARHMIGRGRPFGAGQFAVSRVEVKERPNNPATARQRYVWSPEAPAEDMKGALAVFEEEMERRLKIQAGGWRASEPVQAICSMARPVGWTEPFAYLRFHGTGGGGKGKDFAELRKNAGARAVDVPKHRLRLLHPPGRIIID